MAKKSKKEVEFFKRREFATAYPTRAAILDDDVLSRYISWALVDHSAVNTSKTYLLMTVSAYKKACYRFAPMTDDFARHARHEIAAPLREQYDMVKKCEATIAALRKELNEFREQRTVFEENQLLISQEINAVLILKRKLQGLIEHLKIGDRHTPSALRGFFARIEDFAFNKFTKEAWKTTHRRAKSSGSSP